MSNKVRRLQRGRLDIPRSVIVPVRRIQDVHTRPYSNTDKIKSGVRQCGCAIRRISNGTPEKIGQVHDTIHQSDSWWWIFRFQSQGRHVLSNRKAILRTLYLIYSLLVTDTTLSPRNSAFGNPLPRKYTIPRKAWTTSWACMHRCQIDLSYYTLHSQMTFCLSLSIIRL